MNYPEKYRNFKLVKVYKNLALYEKKNGIRECFSLFDLGIVAEVEQPAHKGWSLFRF